MCPAFVPRLSRLFSAHVHVPFCINFFQVFTSRTLTHHQHQDVQGVKAAQPNTGNSPLATITIENQHKQRTTLHTAGPIISFSQIPVTLNYILARTKKQLLSQHVSKITIKYKNWQTMKEHCGRQIEGSET